MQVEGRLRLFSSFWILPPAGIAVLAATWPAESPQLWSLAWTIPAGLVLWTLVEYALHRFLFHLRVRWQPLQTLLAAMHLRHHREPQKLEYLFVRTEYALGVSGVMGAGIAMATGDRFSTAGLICGLWLGFLAYEAVHYRIHRDGSGNRWLAHRRQAHFRHHFAKVERDFGVTTPIWDAVFRTK
jgi:sterol desaturase/sphingolipid hydroxylase (fatty acid hydroxylase superfamily)